MIGQLLPILYMPDHLKDGRPVLGYDEQMSDDHLWFVMRYDPVVTRWYTIPDDKFRKPTHWAELRKAGPVALTCDEFMDKYE